jgi:phosphoenolpyruvate---glycerone phosphotransferase subunit DhaL
MADCTAQTTADAVRALNTTAQEHREELTTLDRAIGDGDHGENLARGFAAVAAKLDESVPSTPGAVLKLVATTLISTVGGASGPLFGTAFLRAATTLGTAESADASQVAQALEAAAGGVVARGKAVAGDKTMVDAFEPAVRAAQQAAQDGGDVAAVLAAAASAAEEGAAATEPLQARKGRASYLGERSIGHVDPGAQSTAYLLRTLANYAAGA